MWPGTDFGERANEENAKWDPANIPATYFALASLLILGDDLRRVRRKDTLRWVRAMQRDDGSFGETLVEGKREGGRDPRFGYCATGIRHILRGACPPGPIEVDGERIDDINLDTYVRCIRNSEVSSCFRTSTSSPRKIANHVSKELRRRHRRRCLPRTPSRLHLLRPRLPRLHQPARTRLSHASALSRPRPFTPTRRRPLAALAPNRLHRPRIATFRRSAARHLI